MKSKSVRVLQKYISKESGFQTKPLTITIVSGNDSRIFTRNVMACFTHVLSQSWFWAVKIRNSPLIFFQTCAKLGFCLTQMYILAITSHSNQSERNPWVLQKYVPMSERVSGQPWYHNYQDLFWLVPHFLECTGLLQNLSQRNHPLESFNQSRLDALNNHRESS